MSQFADCVDPHNVILRQNGAGSDQYYHCIVNNRPTHPGAESQGFMPQYFVLQDQRRIERLPRPRSFNPPYESVSSITFSVNGFPGVRTRDLDRVIIDTANDKVLEPYGFRSIVISLEWPGYDHWGSSDPMRARIDTLPGGRSITRQDLAREIRGLLVNFHKVIHKHRISPGWERWALTAGPEGIRVSDIVLFSLHYYRNVWVPELYVIE